MAALGLSLTHMACTGEDVASKGSLEFQISGGQALREGFPHTEGSTTYAFADGWSVKFDKYIVSIGALKLTEPTDASVVAAWAGPQVLDLAKNRSGASTLTTLDGIPARRFDLGFELQAPTELPPGSNASQEDLDLMKANHWSMLVGGEATHEESGKKVRFRFGLDVPARYTLCKNGKDGSQGVAIEASKTISVYIYAHAIHFFWDTLGAGDETMRFDAIAAVANKDGVVTEADLAKQSLVDLRDANGDKLRDAKGKRIYYNDSGLLNPKDQNLLGFLKYAARAGVHFNGLGFCSSKAL